MVVMEQAGEGRVLPGRKYISLAIGEEEDTVKTQPQTVWRVGWERMMMSSLNVLVFRNGTNCPGSSGVCCTCCL